MIISNSALEAERLQTLYQLDILDTGREEPFDNIAALAAQICDTRYATISFPDVNRTWFKATIGLDFTEIPRERSLCSVGFYGDDFLEIPDTSKDIRYCNNPFVQDGEKIRFFGGVPLRPINGITIGHLCVADDTPRKFTEQQALGLRMLAKQVETLLLQRYEIKTLKEQSAHPVRLVPTYKSGNKSKDITSNGFFENILNNLPTDIAVFDKNHKYLYVSPKAIANEDLRKFIIGKDDFEYAAFRGWDTSKAELRRKMFLEAIKSGNEIRWEDNQKDVEGNTVTNLRRLVPVHDEFGEVQMIIGFGLDITDRKMLEEKQEAILIQLSYQNKQLTDFCNIVSHNLRGPLVNLSMLTSFIEDAKEEADRINMINMLKPVIENLHEILNELVESIQVKHNHEIITETVYLEEMHAKAIKGLEIEIINSDAEINTDFTQSPQILYSAKYLHSIFHNLISNAIKYRSPLRTPVINVKTERVDDKIILSVADNGLGLDLAKHKDSIFKIGKVFHRNANAKGFGLFMTKTQVEAMGGRIWIESEPDKGTTIFIEFINQ